jgi:hypothetical protein
LILYANPCGVNQRAFTSQNLESHQRRGVRSARAIKALVLRIGERADSAGLGITKNLLGRWPRGDREPWLDQPYVGKACRKFLGRRGTAATYLQATNKPGFFVTRASKSTTPGGQ